MTAIEAGELKFKLEGSSLYCNGSQFEQLKANEIKELLLTLKEQFESKESQTKILLMQVTSVLVAMLVGKDDPESIAQFDQLFTYTLARISDIYCVLPALEIVLMVLNKIRPEQKTAEFSDRVFKTVSWPNLNATSFNYSTRNLIFRIYEVYTIDKTLLTAVDPALFVTCAMSAVENEGDPRNLLLVFQLEAFML